ncbi:MAG: cyclic nucleotide-binding domain-containing protein [Firmicutes bacterium]|nr:cyclic nucleotide-binding domain-containing protein [Bacillota bacterium]
MKRGEGRKLFFFFLLFVFLMISVEIGSGVSMSLFLSYAGSSKLPLIFLFAAILNFCVVITYMFLTASRGNKTVFYLLLGFAVTMVFPLRILLGSHPGIASFLLYILSEFIKASVDLHFSVFISEYFDTMQAKRLFPIIYTGPRFGGLIAGLILTFCTPVIGSLNILFILVLSLLASCVVIWFISKNFKCQAFDFEEHSKETSEFFKHIRSGFRFLKRSQLLKALASGVFLLGFLSLIIKFLYSSSFATIFPDQDKLTAFYGIYIIIANILGFILQITIAGRLINTLGLAATNTTYSVAFSSGFAGLLFFPGILSAIWARFADEQLESVFQDPVETLFYNAVPDNERARAKALSSGMIKPLSEISGSIMLQLFSSLLRFQHIAIIGFVISILFFIVTQWQNKGYVDELMKMVRENTLNLDDLENLRWEKASRKDLEDLYAMVKSDDETIRNNALTLLLHLDEDIDFAKLTESFFKWGPLAQEDFLDSYFKRCAATDSAFISKVLDNSEPSVKRNVVEFLIETRDNSFDEKIRTFITDGTDPLLQNQAVRYCILMENDAAETARAIFRERLQNDETEIIWANLALIREMYDETYLDYLKKTASDKNRKTAIEALNTLSEIYQTRDKDVPEILSLADELIKKGAFHETRAAVRILGKRAGQKEKQLLMKLLDNTSKPLIDLLIEIISRNYSNSTDEFISVIDDHLTPLTLKENMILLLQKMPELSDEQKEKLKNVLKDLMSDFFVSTLDHHTLASAGLEHSLMAELLNRSKAQVRIMILKILEILLHQKVVVSIEKALITKNPRLISNALELFENLWDKKQVRSLVYLLNASSPEEDLEMAKSFTGRDVPDIGEVISVHLKPVNPRWNICAALMLLQEYRLMGNTYEFAELELFLKHSDPLVKEAAKSVFLKTESQIGLNNMLTSIEKVIYLKSAPLFKSLKMDELKVIADISRERDYAPDELIIEKGDAGYTMFIIADGDVEIFLPGKPPKSLTIMKKNDFFGEMALFGADVRSASAKAVGQVKLLCIERDHFINLIYEKPDISIEIIKVLSDRIRKLD